MIVDLKSPGHHPAADIPPATAGPPQVSGEEAYDETYAALEERRLRLVPGRITRQVVTTSSIACAILQLIFSPSLMLAQCLLMCLAGVFLLNGQIKARLLQVAPFSTLVLIGMGATYFYIPLLGTTFYLRTVHNNLAIPVHVFLAALATYICFIGAHRLCLSSRLTRKLRRKCTFSVLKPLGFFIRPKDAQLWMMGLAGVSSFITIAAMGGEDNQTAVVKFFQTFKFFSFAPFLLLVRSSYSSGDQHKKAPFFFISCYTCVLFYLAMSSGSRAFAVIGLVTAALGASLAWWSGSLHVKRKDFGKLILVAVGLVLIEAPLSRAFIAAKAGGAGKGERTLSESFGDFVKAYGDDEVINKYLLTSQAISTRFGAWNEDYLDNEFLRRLANLKFLDNTLKLTLQLSDFSRQRMHEIEAQRIAAILPGPLYKMLGLRVEKAALLQGSMADRLYNESQSKNVGDGGFKTGSIIASAYNLFGLWFPLMMALLACPMFIFLDILAIPPESGERGRLHLSALGLIQIYYIFTMFGSASSVESYPGLMAMVFRNFPQWVLLYFILFWLTRFVSALIPTKSSARHPAY